jgi:hypothetical protein
VRRRFASDMSRAVKLFKVCVLDETMRCRALILIL